MSNGGTAPQAGALTAPRREPDNARRLEYVDMMSEGIRISDRAAERVACLLDRQDLEGSMLRVTVSGGGCSGFQYGFAFDNARNDDDLVFSHAGVDVVIDEMSLELLEGAEIDFVQDMAGSAFRINNPNATASCGCGSSFAV